MTRAAEKLARRAGRERRLTDPDKAIIALRTTKIGPIFPEHNPDASRGMRGINRRDTKRPFGPYGKPRRAHRAITVACLSCKFEATSSTWRQAKRLLTAHAGKKHAGIAK